jgi:hypothetical protein
VPPIAEEQESKLGICISTAGAPEKVPQETMSNGADLSLSLFLSPSCQANLALADSDPGTGISGFRALTRAILLDSASVRGSTVLLLITFINLDQCLLKFNAYRFFHCCSLRKIINALAIALLPWSLYSLLLLF